MTDRTQINALVGALIDGTFGCLDAAAEAINARYGRGTAKGTLSKKRAGLLDWTIAEVIALEDAAGRYPMTRMLARRLAPKVGASSQNGAMQAGIIAKECGEAVAAILSAEMSAGASCRGDALAEIDEAIEALNAARATLEARQD
ncbi:hypothetical protein SAMN05444339_10248 [Loktanella atrilutea]|uniref:Uncharacterized protein n=1 Tax=Loktanella atrilutea TaxID=366533 RepID=A0A1M4WAZ3_LOKAT|nr:hypothetical protein [Loktanella atrilutea]SHE78253.1 hypothetical protein SAMN05444339_10248 [Loktanella atrilutea]